MNTAAPGGDEVWTTERAAEYLNAGPVDFGFSRKQVRRMAQDPGCQIRALPGITTPTGRRSWYRLLASTVRAERARLLAEAGFEDPGWFEGRPG
jgi:hypothetical protein